MKKREMHLTVALVQTKNGARVNLINPYPCILLFVCKYYGFFTRILLSIFSIKDMSKS